MRLPEKRVGKEKIDISQTANSYKKNFNYFTYYLSNSRNRSLIEVQKITRSTLSPSDALKTRKKSDNCGERECQASTRRLETCSNCSCFGKLKVSACPVFLKPRVTCFVSWLGKSLIQRLLYCFELATCNIYKGLQIKDCKLKLQVKLQLSIDDISVLLFQ